MGAAQQFGLILWKNIILRKRQPGILFLELIWPILVFLIVALVRLGSPPQDSHECHYAPRAMPSAGGFAFLQSFSCNLDNQCYPDEQSANQVPNNEGVAEFLKSAEPLFKDPDKAENLLRDLPGAINIVDNLQKALEKPEIQNLIETELTLGSLLLDRNETRHKLVVEKALLPGNVVDAILDSSINITKLFELSGDVNLKDVICDPEELGSYLLLGDLVDELSWQLCNLDSDKIPDLVREIQTQLDVAAIIELISKMKRAVGDYDEAMMLEDISTMVSVLQNTSLAGLIQDSGMNFDLQAFVRYQYQIVKFIEDYLDYDGSLDMSRVQEIFEELEHILSTMSIDASWWTDLQTNMAQIQAVLHWIQDVGPMLTDLNVTMYDILRDSELQSWLQKNMNLTSERVQEIFSVKLDLTKFSTLIAKVAQSGASLEQALCVDPGLTSIYVFPANASSQRKNVEDLQIALCQLNFTVVGKELVDTFHVSDLLHKLEELRSKEIDMAFEGFNWTALYTTGSNLVANIEHMTDWLAPVLNIDGMTLQAMWNSFTETFTDLANFTSVESFNDMLQSYEWASSALASEPTSRLLVVTGSYVMDIAQAVTQMVIDLEADLNEDFKENAQLRRVLVQLVSLDTASLSVVVDLLVDPGHIQELQKSPELFFQSVLCNKTYLLGLAGPEVNVDAISTVLCNSNLTETLQHLVDLLTGMNSQEMLLHVKGILEGSVDISGPEYDERADFIVLYQQVVNFWEYIKENDKNEMSWEDFEEIRDKEGIPITYNAWIAFISTLQEKMRFFSQQEIFATLGQVLEQSDIWPAVGPYISATLDRNTLEAIYQQMLLSGLDERTDMGKLVSDVLGALPDVMEAIAVGLEQPAVALQLASLGRDFCTGSQDDTLHPALLAPGVQTFRRLACETDFTQLSAEYQRVYQMWSESFPDMFEEPWNTTTPLDWSHSYRVLYHIGTEAARTYDGSATEIDKDAYATAARKIYEAMNRTELSRVLRMILYSESSAMNAIEMSMGSSSNMWNVVKYVATASNDIMKVTSKQQADIGANGLRLEDLAMGSPKLRAMLEAQLVLVPDFMDAVSQSILHPEKMIQLMLTTDLTQKEFCKDLSLTEIMSFENSTRIREYEDILCEMDFTVVLQEMMESPSMAEYMDAMNRLMFFNMTVAQHFTAAVNWSELAINFEGMLATSTMNTSNLFSDVPGFDMAEIESTVNRLISQTNGIDLDFITKLYQIADDMWLYLQSLMGADPKSEGIAMATHDSLLMANAFYGFINPQLSKMIGTNVSVTDILKSDELLKFTQIPQEAQQIVLKGIVSLLTDPEKMMDLGSAGEDFLRICEDAAVFQKVFPVPEESSMDAATLQAAVCGVAGVNYTKLWMEVVESMEGLQEYINLVNQMSTPEGLSNISLNISELIENILTYQHLLEAVTQDPPTLLWSDLSMWTQADDWTSTVQQIMTQLENLQQYNVTDLANLDFVGLMSLFISDTGELDFLSKMNAYVEALITDLKPYVGSNINLDNLVSGATETTKLLRLMRNLPIMLEVGLATMTTDQQKLMSLVMSPDPLATLCSTSDLDTLFVIPSTRRSEFTNSVHSLCDINIDAIGAELGIRFSVFGVILAQNESYPSANMTTLNANFMMLSQLLTQLAGQTSWTENYSWLLDYDWMEAFNSVAGSYQNTTTLSGLNDVWDILPYLSSLVANTYDLNQYIAKSNAVTEAMIAELTPFIGQNVTIKDLLSGAVETQKLMAYMNKLPVVYQVMIATGLTKSDQLGALLGSGDVLTTLCTSDLDVVFEIPAAVRQDFIDVVRGVCAINMSAVVQELSQKYGPIIDVYMSNKTYDPIDPAILTANMMTLNQLWTQLSEKSRWTEDYSWLRNFDWAESFNSIVQQYQSQEAWTSTLENLLPYLDDVVANLGNISALREFDTNLQAMARLMEMLSFVREPTALFDGFPHMKKLIDIQKDAPDLIAILAASALDEAKFSPLLAILVDNASAVCEMTNVEQYLTVPEGVDLDLGDIKTTFCNQDQYRQELLQFASKYYDIIMGPADDEFNLTRTIVRLLRAQEHLTEILSTNFTLPADLFPWLQLEKWENALETISRNLPDLDDPTAAAQQYFRLSEIFKSTIVPTLASLPQHVQNQLGAILTSMIAQLQMFTERSLSETTSNATALSAAINQIIGLSMADRNKSYTVDELSAAIGEVLDLYDALLSKGAEAFNIDPQALGRILQEDAIYIKLVEMLKSSVPLEGTWWAELDRNLHTASAIMAYINKLVDNMKEGGNVNLANIVPDLEVLRKLLEASVDPQNTELMLLAVTNLDMFVNPMDQAKFVEVVCNLTSFQENFDITQSGADPEPVQEDVCRAAKDGDLLIQQILDLIDINLLYQQLTTSLTKENTGSPGIQYISQVNMFIKNIQSLAGAEGSVPQLMIKLEDIAAIWDESLSAEALTFSLASCNKAVDSLEALYPGEVHSSLAMSQFYLNVSVLSLQATTELENLVCQLPSMNITDLLGMWNSSSAAQMLELYMQVLGGEFQGARFDCGEYKDLVEQYIRDYEQAMNTLSTKMHNVLACMEKQQGQPIPAFTQVDSVLMVLREVRDLLGTSMDWEAMFGVDFISIMDDVIRAFVQQRPALLSLEDIWLNKTSLAESLYDLLQISPDIIKQILTSSIDLNLLSLQNVTGDNLAQLLCDPDALEKLLHVPDVFINMTVVSQYICGQTLNETIKLIMEGISVGNVLIETLNRVPQYGLSTEWLMQLLDSMIQLTNDMNSIAELSDLLSDFDDIGLVSLLGQLQTFLQDNTPDRIFDNIHKFLDQLRPLLPPGEGQKYLDDLGDIANGIRGLNILKSYLPFDAVVGSLVKDEMAFRSYLVNDLGLAPDVADAVMKASLSYSKMINLQDMDLKKAVCDPSELKELLSFDDEDDVSFISQTLCDLPEDDIIDIFDTVIQDLDIGTLIRDFMTLEPEQILKELNMTLDDVKNITAAFEPFKDQFQELIQGFSLISSNFTVPDLNDVISEEQRGLATLGSFSEMLCGREAAFQVEDSYGVGEYGGTDGKRRKKRETSKISDYDRQQIAELDTEFCKDMYQAITSTEFGPIVWSYLKPLLRGKILYSPNTTQISGIMERATELFRDVEVVETLSKSLYDGFTDFGDQTGSKNYTLLKKALKNPFIAGAVAETVGFDASDLVDSLEALNDLDPEEISKVRVLAGMTHNMTQCLAKDRLQGFRTEAELETEAETLVDSNNLLAGVVFISHEDKSGKTPLKVIDTVDDLPLHVGYKIRMEVENTPTTTKLFDGVWTPVPEDDFATNLRYLRGFVELQDMIESAIIEMHGDGNETGPSVHLQQFPYPCHRRDQFQLYIGTYFFPILMTLAWLVAVGSAINSIVYDKEKRLEETMKIMGLRSGVNWLGWFFSTFVGMLIVSFFLTLILKFGKLMPYSDPFFIFVYLADFSLAVTMFSYMISTFFTRTTVASLSGVIAYLVSYLPFVILVSFAAKLLFWHQILIFLSATSAFSFGGQLIARYEQQGQGLQWDNASDEIGWGITFDWCCYMMLIDAGIYGLIGWYIRNVFPGRYGVAQPWYFPVSPAYWGCCCVRGKNQKKSSKHMPKDGIVDGEGPGEPEPGHLPIGIAAHNLRKVYKKRGKANHVAIEDLSVNIFKGQITAFLGQNGAGKTTTVNMLTGYYTPTAGTAYVEGWNIRQNVPQIRKELGICPQHDVLFESMTVKEHLDLFVSLKSSASRKQKRAEINRMLGISGLSSCSDTKACKLSGGQRRRLCVVIAFIGGSKVIILDEPTSGVDPSARRAIWDLIVKHREGRTILLSTHHLYEADILGDRILMIHQGKLVCSGSPLYLKTHYGSGYHLTLSKELNTTSKDADGRSVTVLKNTADSNKILSFIQQHVPDARVSEEIGTELTVILPTDHGQVANFQRLFAHLDSNMSPLGVASYGLSDTSLEEVFLKLVHQTVHDVPIEEKSMKELNWKGLSDVDSDRDSGLSEPTTSGTMSSAGSSVKKINMPDLAPSPSEYPSPLSSKRRVTGCPLVMTQFGALFAKRIHHHKRDSRSYFSQLILPILFICLAMGVSKIKPATDDMPSLMMSPALYSIAGDPTNMFFRVTDSNEMNDAYVQTLLQDPGVGTTCMEGSDLKYLCSASINPNFKSPSATSSKASLYDNPEPCQCEDGRTVCPEGAGGWPQPHTKTRAKNNLYNITGSQFQTDEYLLRTHPDFIHDRIGGLSLGADDEMRPEAKVWFNNKAWHAIPAFYNSLSNMALRANKGANSSQYGITAYNHPLRLSREQLSVQVLLRGVAETGIALTILLAFCFVPAGYAIYLIQERVSNEKRQQFVCGVGLGTYWMTSLIWDLLAYLLTVALAVAVTVAFNIPVYTARLNLGAFAVSIIMFGWASIPLMYLMVRKFTQTATGYITLFTINLLIGITTTACVFLLSLFLHDPMIKRAHEILSAIFLIFPQFCLGDALIKLSRNQFLADINKRFHIDSYVNPFTTDMLVWHFVAMALEGFFFLVLHFIIESRPCDMPRDTKLASVAHKSGLDSLHREKMNPTHQEDENVSLERQRVMTGEARDDPLVFYNLKKVYKKGSRKLVAVDNVTMAVPRGECFGLLGVNGAGKTTTFHMITGEVVPTAGAALLDGEIISKNLPDTDQRIGYCPQTDALDPNLTVREILYCYGRLKGIPGNSLGGIAAAVMQKLALEPYANRSVKHLSGGTQRKLSTAVALLGDPEILLLDEPTTGMDPQTRRLVWNTIRDIVKDNRSVVLTSHSMEECEALCTRLAIMVNGRFQCLGNRQHLKNRFGNGYTVTVKATQNVADLSSIVNYMLSTFRGAIVKDQHLNMLEFEIPYSSARLSDIFGSLDQSRTHLSIQDYSVTQTSLEQVFVNFARYQTDGHEKSSKTSDPLARPPPPRVEHSPSEPTGYTSPRPVAQPFRHPTGYSNPAYDTFESTEKGQPVAVIKL